MTKNISAKMDKVLPREIIDLLRRIGNAASSNGFRAFIVGGIVRDILSAVRNIDLDIVIEGDAIKLGEELAEECNAKIVTHKVFGTCTITTKDNLKVDLATARRETYEKPAALPSVVFASLKDDLARRDFSINAMAVSINDEDFGDLIDPFKGESDLLHGSIKVLHGKSFIDDPTRIFRAVRFESRPGFIIEERTLLLAKEAIKDGMIGRLSKYRVKKELALISKEENREKAIKRLAELGAGNISQFKI